MATRYQWFDNSGCISLELRQVDLDAVPRHGRADEAIAGLRKIPRIAKMLETLKPCHVREALREISDWDPDELADESDNLDRLLWIAICDTREDPACYAAA